MPPTAGATWRESWKTDDDESHRSHVIPASRTTPSCTRLTATTRTGQVGTVGRRQPGMKRSSTMQQTPTAMMYQSMAVSFFLYRDAGRVSLTAALNSNTAVRLTAPCLTLRTTSAVSTADAATASRCLI